MWVIVNNINLFIIFYLKIKGRIYIWDIFIFLLFFIWFVCVILLKNNMYKLFNIDKVIIIWFGLEKGIIFKLVNFMLCILNWISYYWIIIVMFYCRYCI